MLKTILLHAPLHVTDPGKGSAAAALALAARHRASATALLFDYNVHGQHYPAADAAETTLRETASTAGVELQTVTTHSHAQGIHEVVADYARLHDLVISGTDDRGILPERQVSEYLLFESGRPVLLVPAGQRRFEFARAALAWDGSRAAARALGDALPLLVDAETVSVLHLGDDKDMNGCFSPEQVEEALRARGLPARFHRAERGNRTIATALAEEAKGLGAGLLVMGAYTRSRLTERLLGGATRGTLDRPLLPTLLSH